MEEGAQHHKDNNNPNIVQTALSNYLKSLMEIKWKQFYLMIYINWHLTLL